MLFEINRKVFEKGIKYCCGICNIFNESSPILNSLLVEVKNKEINIFSSNLFTSTKYVIKDNFRVKEEGKFLIKGKVINEIISKLNTETIRFKKIDNVLHLKSDKFEYNLNILDHECFPVINFDIDTFKKELTIKTNDLINIDKKISNSIINAQLMNNPSTRIFSSINLKFNNKKLEAVATDGFKLSYMFFKNDSDDYELNLDQTTIKLISNLFKENENVKFKVIDDEKILVEYDNIILITRLIEGKFPNYKSLIFNDPTIEFKLKKQDFINSIERGLVLNSNKKRPIVKLEIKDKELWLFYSSDEIGNSIEKLEINELKGNLNISLVYNINFLLSLLKNFSGDILTMRIKNESSPIIITDNATSNFLQLMIGLKSF